MSARSAIAAAALVAAACAPERASLSVSAQTSIAAPSTTSAMPMGTGSLDLGNGIAVDQIRISFTQVALDDDGCEHRTGATGGGNGGGKGRGRGHCRDDFWQLVADLPAGNLDQLTQLVRSTVLPGTFQHVRLSIGPATAGAGSSSAVADLAARQASLIVDGTVDGKPFSFVSSFAAAIDVAGDVVVSPGVENNVTVSMDPSSWFGGTGSDRLDPTVPSNQTAIESNVAGSITAFEDDDHEHHRHRTGSGGGGGGE